MNRRQHIDKRWRRSAANFLPSRRYPGVTGVPGVVYATWWVRDREMRVAIDCVITCTRAATRHKLNCNHATAFEVIFLVNNNLHSSMQGSAYQGELDCLAVHVLHSYR